MGVRSIELGKIVPVDGVTTTGYDGKTQSHIFDVERVIVIPGGQRENIFFIGGVSDNSPGQAQVSREEARKILEAGKNGDLPNRIENS